MEQYKIYSVNGPVVKVTGGRGLAMKDMVYVGSEQLIGEVVSVDGDMTTVQVYEDTAGLEPGQVVTATGAPMSLRLGPGLLGHIFDGIGRPLKALEEISGPFLGRGVNLPSLDLEQLWSVTVDVKEGDQVQPGVLYAHCRETDAIVHRCLIPAGLTGTVTHAAADGDYNVDQVLVEVTDRKGNVTQLKLSADCSIRDPRPIARAAAHHPAPGYRTADHRHPLSHRQGGRRRHSRALRRGQDHDSAPAGQVVGRGYHRLPGLRRAGQ